MLDGLLPPGVHWVQATEEMRAADLFESEFVAVQRAVPERVAEFRAGRAAARAALAHFGVPALPIPVDTNRSPVWPAGFIGSITHCPGLCLVAVARGTELTAIGIDAEPAEPLPPGVLDLVTNASERERLTDPIQARVLFSAKEAFYKCWSTMGGRFLEFDEAEVRFGDGTFVATADGTEWSGRWRIRNGFVTTTCWT